MITSYKTIAAHSEGIYREKGSKFISKAYPLSGIGDIQSNLSKTKKEYHDARHHCYAYVLGPSCETWKVNDDGEPSHSAGDPILNQIRSFELTNILVVVVRYFGGTKLGVPGLINAYKTATREAIQNSRIVNVTLKKYLLVRYPYESTSEVMKMISDVGAHIEEQEFSEDCMLRFSVPIEEEGRTVTRLQEMELMNLIQILQDQSS